MSSEKKKTKLSISVPERTFVKIDHSTLAQWLNSKTNVLIIDVREDDYIGGNIPGSIHIPFSEFELKVNEIIKPKIEKNTNIVFVGMYSQQRAPNSASTFAEKMNDQIKNLQLKVFVLSGGMFLWLKHYKNTKLVENYDEKYWDKQLELHVHDAIIHWN